MIERTFVASPLGTIALAVLGDALTELRFVDDAAVTSVADLGAASTVTKRAVEALAAYFEGELQSFDLPLAPQGTPFQQAVWSELSAIPFGETRTYGQIAGALGKPTASRAVGAANGRNPIALIVPCHRVIGRNGSLTGFAYGVARKAWLLRHEGRAGVLAQTRVEGADRCLLPSPRVPPFSISSPRKVELSTRAI